MMSIAMTCSFVEAHACAYFAQSLLVMMCFAKAGVVHSITVFSVCKSPE